MKVVTKDDVLSETDKETVHVLEYYLQEVYTKEDMVPKGEERKDQETCSELQSRIEPQTVHKTLLKL